MDSEQAPYSLLVADDDAAVRCCLKRAVESDPRMEIRWEAANGLEALRMALERKPALILLDADMPRMDGVEVVRCLRRKGWSVPIIVMSVYESLRETALAAGANDFLAKDCGCEAIRASIRNLLGE